MSAGSEGPQPVFNVTTTEEMELFLCPKLKGLDLFSSQDGMPLLHYCVSPKEARILYRVSPRETRIKHVTSMSMVSENILESLADQVNVRWSEGPNKPALTPGMHKGPKTLLNSNLYSLQKTVTQCCTFFYKTVLFESLFPRQCSMRAIYRQ